MSKTGKHSYCILIYYIARVVIYMSGCNLFCGSNRSNGNIIWAAIVALILINCLDDDCIQSVAAFLVTVGDAMILGASSNCFGNNYNCRSIKNSYY